MTNKNLQRFLKYAKIDTQSDDTTGKTPSTEKQKKLGKLLVEELLELGLKDAHMDEWGVVYAHLEGEGHKIGLNAHMDTALEVSGKDVNPQIITNYDGGDINYLNGLIMNPSMFPSLKKHIGHDLVIGDGNTLLGGDDKSGIAIIMSVLEYLKDHPEIKHNTICVAFTVDEEIGEGAAHFNYEKMGADFAYTIDGANIDYIEFENFNASGVDIEIDGVSIHPGEGKNKLVNAILVANEMLNALPKNETPFDSELKEGFWHVTDIEGGSDKVKLHMIIRDFELSGINRRLMLIEEAKKKALDKFPTAKIKIETKYQYENMRTYVKKNPLPVKLADEALRKNGFEPIHAAIRGGTDGATFSKNGLICPNLGTGSYNHHGRFEYLDVYEFEQMIQIVLDIIKL